MRRMYSLNQLEEVARDQAKLVKKDIATLVDADGHDRFIEGDIKLSSSITYLTKVYGKWSLSGTHLMLVLCIKTDENTPITSSIITQNIDLPNWVKDKIVTTFSTYIEIKGVVARDDSLGNTTTLSCGLIKSSNNVVIAFTSGATHTVPLNARITFDLLIDND